VALLVAPTALCLRYITEHLFHVGATAGPTRLVTLLAFDSPTHTPQGITDLGDTHPRRAKMIP